MLKSAARIGSFFSKWLAEIVRQPALMVTLVVGPFLILLLVGMGIDLGGPRPRAIVVTPADGGSEAIDPLPEELDEVDIIQETTDLAAAQQRLRDGEADTVVVMPPDPLEAIQRGEHAPIDVYTNEIDPVARSYFNAYLRDQVSTLNEQAIEKAITEATAEIEGTGELLASARQFVGFVRDSEGAGRQPAGIAHPAQHHRPSNRERPARRLVHRPRPD